MTSLQLKPAPANQFPLPSTPPFQLFDLSVVSDFSFKYKFPPTAVSVDLIFTCQREPALDIVWETVEPLCVSQGKTKEGQSPFVFFAVDSCIMLRFTNIADFYLWSDRIVCHLINPAYEFMVEICFLGTVLACWFELQGVLALHASALVINGQAAAFLSSNKGGKTSLAAGLMQQGFPLLTDDILLVEMEDGRPIGRSGYPQMRMWPEQAALIFGNEQEFSAVHPYLDKRRIPIDFENPRLFQSGRFPITRCYIPDRYESVNNQAEITITPISTVESVLMLAGFSFLFWLVDQLGLQPNRLKTFSQIVQTVSVNHLTYPSGVEHLPAVCHAVEADLQ